MVSHQVCSDFRQFFSVCVSYKRRDCITIRNQKSINRLTLFPGMGTIFTLTALAIQRCIFVWYPSSFSFNTYGYCKATISMVWFMSGLIAVPPLIGWSEYVPEQSGLRYEKIYLQICSKICSEYIFDDPTRWK